MKRTKGGQPGNRNAMKHGFYSKVLSQEDVQALQQARSVSGLDSEIAIVRMKFRQLLERDPDNAELMFRASAILARLVRVDRQLKPRQAVGLQQAVGNVMRELASPLKLNSFLPPRKSESHPQENPALSPSEVEDSPARKD